MTWRRVGVLDVGLFLDFFLNFCFLMYNRYNIYRGSMMIERDDIERVAYKVRCVVSE